VCSCLQVPAEHGSYIARDVPNTRSLENLIRAVPGCQEVDASSSSRGFENTKQETETIDLLLILKFALGKGQDRPSYFHSRDVPAREFRARDDHHAGDFEDEVADVVESAEEGVSMSCQISKAETRKMMNLLVLCKLQFFFHARDISAVQSVLVKPFDVEAKTAQSQQDAIELPEQLLLLLGVVTWVPIEDIQPSKFQRSGWFLSRRAHEGKLCFLLKLGLKVRRC
jgi:hypothetical protein